ncbi:MAG: RsmE family RNA methyltransferase [Actinomycetota bacterium]
MTRQPPWFYAPVQDWSDAEIVLPVDESHHATKVMRISPPDVITVTDGKGTVARCAAARVDGERLVAEILERDERRRARPEIVVYQGAAKGHKLDDIIERLAELGVAEVWAYESQRSVVKWDAKKVARATERWTGIARSAAKQSRNAFMLHAGGGLSWSELVRRVAKEPFTVVLWEEASLPLRTALSGSTDRVALVVGPEGGLSREEAEALADAGAQLTSLGPTILRTENAPVVAVSALLFHYGLIG